MPHCIALLDICRFKTQHNLLVMMPAVRWADGQPQTRKTSTNLLLAHFTPSSAQQPHRCPLNKNKYFHNKTGNISRLAAARVPNVPAAARYLLELSTGLFSQCPGWPGMEHGKLVYKINNISRPCSPISHLSTHYI